MVESMKFGYEKHNTDVISGTDKKRICGYFVVSDLHKVTDGDICFRTQVLIEEIASMRVGCLNQLYGMLTIKLI